MQIIANVFLAMAFIVLCLAAERKMNPSLVIEMGSHVTVLLSQYHLMLYNDYVDSPGKRYMLGWSNSIILLAVIIINLSFIFIITIKSCIDKAKKERKFCCFTIVKVKKYPQDT
jgi:hypothetical protein